MRNEGMKLVRRIQTAGVNYDKPIVVAAYAAVPIGAILATVLFLLSTEVEVVEAIDACEKWKASSVMLERPFEKERGHAFLVRMPTLATMADNSHNPRRSSVMLCENGQPIGPAHSLHEDIRTKGSGQFSHWSFGVLFSTPDNSDPNSNGREYKLVRRP
jgi:hypothetical protein